jgi:hypothetical protein
MAQENRPAERSARRPARAAARQAGERVNSGLAVMRTGNYTGIGVHRVPSSKMP